MASRAEDEIEPRVAAWEAQKATSPKDLAEPQAGTALKTRAV